MADETRTLAKFVTNFKLEDAPAPIRDRMHDLLVDQIGVEIGCSHLPWAQQVRETYRRVGGAPEATVLGYGDKLPLTSVAFINATFGHSFEYDDANPLVHGHPGCELVPSLLAVAEREHCSGLKFLTTLTATYEIRGRMGWAVSPDMLEHGGPQYSTNAAPSALRRRCSVARLVCGRYPRRDGDCRTFSGGLMQYDHGGGSAKRIFGAVAAINGMQSALLAQAGITGPEEIIEGKRGLCGSSRRSIGRIASPSILARNG